MSVFDIVLIILACVFFFIAAVSPHLRNNPQPSINWLAWGLFCWALSVLPWF